MFEGFKAFLNKEGVDYSQGLIDPFKFHKTFYKILVLFKVADVEHKHKPTWMNQNAVLFIFGLTATIFSAVSLCRGIYIFELPHITEAGTYTIVLFYEFFILATTKRNLPQYHNLLRDMVKDFYFICTDGNKYRQKYFQVQLETWKICIMTLIFMASMPIGMVLFAFLSLTVFHLTHSPGDGSSRPLLFPFWLPDVDFGESPVYELMFMYSSTCVILYGYTYVFMLQTQIVWIRHITSKVDIIIWSIHDLLEGVRPATSEGERKYYAELIQTRFRRIVRHHHGMLRSLEDYAIVYKKMLMYEQKFCGPLVTLTSYCTAEKLDEGEFNAILMLLCLATIVLHFIPSYCCTFLAMKVRSICDACWDIPFWTAGPVIRPYMVLIMQRSLRPLPLAAPGFKPISIETFSQKMASAYSYFNMLRQTNL